MGSSQLSVCRIIIHSSTAAPHVLPAPVACRLTRRNGGQPAVSLPSPCLLIHSCPSRPASPWCLQAHPVHLWDASSGELRCSYRGHDDVDEVTAAYSLAFSPDGLHIYAGGQCCACLGKGGWGLREAGSPGGTAGPEVSHRLPLDP